VPRKLLKEERKALVALFRGIAKSTLFSHHNLDAGIDLHWAVYPESRPKGRSEEEARKELAFILKDRKNSWMRRPTTRTSAWARPAGRVEGQHRR
jgi:NitT/TauT family transport system substrate-binding protein